MTNDTNAIARRLHKEGIKVLNVMISDEEIMDDSIILEHDMHVQVGNDDILILWQEVDNVLKIVCQTSNSKVVIENIKKYVDSLKDKAYKEMNESKNDTQSTEEKIMTTKEMLIELNECRALRGMKPLKAWKESRAKLEAKINELHNTLDERAEEGDELAEEKMLSVHNDDDAPTTVEKKTPAKKTNDKKIPAEPKNENTVSLADLARECNMRPQTARAKFRRILKRDEKAPRPLESSKWEFDAKHRKELIALLKG